MHAENHIIILTKQAQRALQDKAIENNTTTLLAGTNSKSLAVSGWTVERLTSEYPKGWSMTGETGDYEYRLYLVANYNRNDSKKPGKGDLAAIARKIHQRAAQPAFGKWAVSWVDGAAYTHTDDDDEESINVDTVGYAEVEVPDDFESFFSHLYGLEPHVGRVKRALEAGVISGWMHRQHVALIGPPGCGKSDICSSLKKALGDDAVLEYDGTAMTSAGAIKELSEREILPRVLVVEEIEKADEKCLAFLLGVMDMRAEIRKTTARSSIQRDTKLFCIATVNNLALFRKIQSGALSSRFNNPVFFNRPSREQLALILHREIKKVKGDERWIAPTLDWCDEHNVSDPREAISIAVCGRDMLLTGEYQKMMEATSEPQMDMTADWMTVGGEDD